MKKKTTLLLLLCMAFTLCASAQIPASSYELSENGTTLKRWKGQETKIDMEADPVLKKVTTIGMYAFVWKTSLTTIKLPESLLYIDQGAFSFCANLTGITIPNSVEFIGNDAFSMCDKLTMITLPKSLNHIGAEAFIDCPKLTSIDIDPLNTNFSSKEGVVFNKSQDSLICYPAGKSASSYTIPPTTKKIGLMAFVGCENLTHIIIPKTVNQISERAFFFCLKLTSFTVDPENSHFSSIEGVVFNKKETSLIYYPSGKADASYSIPSTVTEIGASAFQACKSLETVTIPNSVTKIGGYAFRRCENLTKIMIPNSVTSIENNTFSGCSKLSNLIIPNSVTNIGDNAFSTCRGLTEITIPNSVENMGVAVFGNCKKLTKINVDPKNSNFSSIEGVLFNKSQDSLICYPAGKSESSYTVPLSTKKIGPEALADGENLKEIRFLGGVPSFDRLPFQDFFIERIIVPKGTLGAYKAALPESADKIVEGDYSTSALRVTKQMIRCYPTIVTDQLVVESDSEIKQLTLLNSAGGAILNLTKVNSHRTTLQLSTLPHGIYLLTVKSDRGDTTTKIIKR